MKAGGEKTHRGNHHLCFHLEGLCSGVRVFATGVNWAGQRKTASITTIHREVLDNNEEPNNLIISKVARSKKVDLP